MLQRRLSAPLFCLTLIPGSALEDVEVDCNLSAVSYRADAEVLEFLKSLETSRCPYVLKPSEWQLSANAEFVYVIWPDHKESFFLFNIWKGMSPSREARLRWAKQFVEGALGLQPEFSKLFLDLSPRIDSTGALYLDTDLGIQKYFQNIRPTREREGLPWSFLSTSAQNKRVVPVFWLGYHVYTILTNGRAPLSEKFRLYLASVPPGLKNSPFGPFPPYQNADEWDQDINNALRELLSIDTASQLVDREQAYRKLERVLDRSATSSL